MTELSASSHGAPAEGAALDHWTLSDFDLNTEFGASVTLHQAGQPEQASRGYRRVLAAVPHQPTVQGYLGLALAQAGRHEAAVTTLRRSLVLSQDDHAVLNNLGNALAALGRPAEAGVAYRKSIALLPFSGQPLFNCGVLEPEPNRRVTRLLRSVWCDATYVPALAALTGSLSGTGSLAAAQQWARRAAAMGPQESITHFALADHLLSTGQAESALLRAARALTTTGDPAAALVRLGMTSERLGALDDAGRYFRRTLAMAPESSLGHSHLGSLLLAFGFPAEAVTRYRRASAIEGRASEMEGNRLFAMAFLAHADPQALTKANRHWAERAFPEARNAPPSVQPRASTGRMRIGYVSHEFVKHASLLHLLPMLDHHDRSRFEIFGYAQMTRSDGSTDEVRRRCDRWRSIGHLPLAEQAAAIVDDGVDILVNLTGYIATQRALFARRIAPVQVAYMNHVSTTGLPTIDCRITDPWLEPVGAPFLDREERLCRLQTGYLCYAPPEAPPVDSLPAARRSFVTFGVFNNLAKASDAAIAVWARVLHRVPRSRILLKGYGLSAAFARARILAVFQRHGIEAGRIDMVGRVDGDFANLSTIAEADIALDPFPFNGGMSTVETLWMGVPVVSLAGPSLVHRIGLTFLTRAGFPEWVARSEDAYVDIAAALAADIDGLTKLRYGMRDRLRQSVLFDAASHARELEGVYVGMWNERTGQSR